MQAAQSHRRDLGLDGRTQDRMPEATRRDGAEDAELEQRVGGGRDEIGVEARQRDDRAQVGVGLEDRDGVGDGPRPARQAADARQCPGDHRPRRDAVDRVDARRRAVRTRVSQRSQELRDMERVTVG